MRRFLWFVLAIAVPAAACSNSNASSLASTIAPTPTVVTEMFTGTVIVGGSDAHPFTVTVSGGQINVILTAAGPPPTIYMGLGVGTPSGSSCTLLSGASTATPAGTIAQLTGTITAGSYCVQVFDIGNQTVDVTYSLTVIHY